MRSYQYNMGTRKLAVAYDEMKLKITSLHQARSLFIFCLPFFVMLVGSTRLGAALVPTRVYHRKVVRRSSCNKAFNIKYSTHVLASRFPPLGSIVTVGRMSQGKHEEQKVKGPKGGYKAPIYRVPPDQRLFTAEEGLIRHEVQCFSLYHFIPIDDPDDVVAHIRETLQNAGPLEHFAGTMYVSPEGFNAQFSVTNKILSKIDITSVIEDASSRLLGTSNLDLNYGVVLPEGSPTPFKRVRIVSRPQILTDGLPPTTSKDTPWNWNDSGQELDPPQWHAELNKYRGSNSNEEDDNLPLLLDCRNKYESDAGSFQSSKPLGTQTFSESWKSLDDAVSDIKNKDEPVYMFCTGGIRCVKAGAYLKQNHGLTNVRRLRHGIIGYEKWINEVDSKLTNGAIEKDVEKNIEESSLFEGENFIFDQRNVA